jgi:hypothetical protein
VVSPDDWLVSSIWFLLCTGQIVIGTWVTSVCARWSNLLFLPGGSCFVLSLQFCQISSSPSKVGQFCSEHCSQSHETSSVITHIPALGGWLIAPPSFSPFVPHHASAYWYFGFFGMLACHPTPPLCLCSLSHLHLLRVNESSLPHPPILRGWFPVPPHPYFWW